MTNSDEIARELNKKCDHKHVHQHLMDGRASAAARYPEGLCRAICCGLAKELRNEAQSVKALCQLSLGPDTKIEEYETQEEMVKKVPNKKNDEDRECEWLQAWDDITGADLNPTEVRRARIKEVGYIKSMEVWVKITRAEAIKRGIKVVGTRWIDVKKGDEANTDIRRSLVAQ